MCEGPIFGDDLRGRLRALLARDGSEDCFTYSAAMGRAIDLES
jgi:hypothetical protein